MNKKLILAFGLIASLGFASCDNSEIGNIKITHNYSEDEIFVMQIADFMADATIDAGYETGDDPREILESWIYETAYDFYGEENWNESLEFWFTDLNIKDIYDLEKFLLSEIWIAYLMEGNEEMAKKSWEAQYT